jgi:hypothetical protein
MPKCWSKSSKQASIGRAAAVLMFASAVRDGARAISQRHQDVEYAPAELGRPTITNCGFLRIGGYWRQPIFLALPKGGKRSLRNAARHRGSSDR